VFTINVNKDRVFGKQETVTVYGKLRRERGVKLGGNRMDGVTSEKVCFDYQKRPVRGVVSQGGTVFDRADGGNDPTRKENRCWRRLSKFALRDLRGQSEEVHTGSGPSWGLCSFSISNYIGAQRTEGISGSGRNR